MALKKQTNLSYKTLDKLYHTKNSKQMWNMIRKSKSVTVNSDAISMSTLENHFAQKFAPSKATSDAITAAEERVRRKYKSLCDASPDLSFVISEHCIKRYIKQLNSGTSPGYDGIQPEHLKHALDSNLAKYLSVMFTLCLRFGLVPESFKKGLLVPILKKSNIDPTKPNNYRPITVSVTLSKILEYYILDRTSSHEYSDYQFGFVPKRNTSMATALVHDVTTYCKSAGSSVFLCSLDAEGAFDGIPHSVLFDCAYDTIPDSCWINTVQLVR